MTKDRIVPKQMLVPFVLITFLFALWGFANDITNPMVAAFQKVLEISTTKAALVQFAFYGGYFTMALPAAIFIRKYSYKAGILIGLSLYAIGALLFFPAAQFEVFTIFLIAYYIMTFGLAFLETTSNPYILSMGSDETSTRRLNLAQSFNPIGSLSGMLVAQMFILQALKSNVADYKLLPAAEKALIKTADLQTIRNPYIILGIVVIIVFVVIALYKMPKNQNSDHEVNIKGTIAKLFKIARFREGVITQAFYVGGQIMLWTFIFQYAENIGVENSQTVYYNMVAMGLFLFGRFVFTFLLKYINAGKLLMILAMMAIVFTLGAIFIQGMTGLYSLVLISFCMSLMFPTIYGISLKGLGEDAKFGSAFLVMAIVGGALLPMLQASIMDIGGKGFADTLIMGVPEVNFSFVLPLFSFIIVTIFGYRTYKIHLKDS